MAFDARSASRRTKTGQCFVDTLRALVEPLSKDDPGDIGHWALLSWARKWLPALRVRRAQHRRPAFSDDGLRA